MDARGQHRVLIINGQSIYKNNATGITLESIFSNWPNEKLLEIFIWENDERRKTKYAIKSIKAQDSIFPINSFLRKFIRNRIETNKKTSSNKESNVGILSAIKDCIKFFSEYLICLNRASSLIQDIEKYNPEIIYTLGNSIQAMRLAYKISIRYDLPIVVHFMDNWRETVYLQNPYTKYLNRAANRIVNKLESRMAVGLTISEKMSFDYENKYGKKYKALMNCVDNIPNELPAFQNATRICRLVYAGGLHLSRFKSLLVLESALEELSKNGLKSKLDIYTNDIDRDCYEHLFNNKYTTFNKFVTRDKVKDIYEQGHLLVHIESFDSDIVEYTKYSISTKIPEYMASGKPIICFSPKSIAVSQYISDNEVGITAESYEELLSGIEKLFVDKKFYDQCAINGIKTAQKSHDSAVSFRTLKAVINSGISNEFITSK